MNRAPGLDEKRLMVHQSTWSGKRTKKSPKSRPGADTTNEMGDDDDFDEAFVVTLAGAL
jgi:hypothetical protein